MCREEKVEGQVVPALVLLRCTENDASHKVGDPNLLAQLQAGGFFLSTYMMG